VPDCSAGATGDFSGANQGWICLGKAAVKTRAVCRLGAASTGGLALPAANPTPTQMYAPRGVFLNDEWLLVADSGNHRILLWKGLPLRDGQPADVVLCQPDFFTEGSRANGRGPENGLNLPTGVAIHNGNLIVADPWHHRILVWEEVPTMSDTPPGYALGQPNLTSVEPNQGGEASSHTLYWPYGFGFAGDWFYIADTGNRRILGWHGFPLPGGQPDVILGQSNGLSKDENRGGPVSARSFRWPHAIAGSHDRLYVADAGNHRVLGWEGLPTQDCDADLVLGQKDFTSAIEWPYTAQGPAALRFPYSLALEGGLLAVADTANNRVLFWENLPGSGAGIAAHAVAGQADFQGNGENHWKSIGQDTLCWPYAVALHQNRLVVADSGNNRVTIWEIERASDEATIEQVPMVVGSGESECVSLFQGR
jgi:hypothetical protein